MSDIFVGSPIKKLSLSEFATDDQEREQLEYVMKQKKSKVSNGKKSNMAMPMPKMPKIKKMKMMKKNGK